MKSFKVLWVVVFACSVSGQYNFQPQEDVDGYQYQQPQPAPTYLPPTTTQQPVTRNPYESETDIAAEGQGPPNDDADHAPGMPYDFTYAVKDDYGNDFAHKADSDGEVVKGEYRTLLPDGRMQIVKYTADWKNGFNADVSYEGQAIYPEDKPASRRPYVPPPTPATRQPFFPPQSTRQPGFPPTETRPPFVPPTETRPPFVPPTKNPNEFEEDIDSQGLYPSKAPPSYTTTPPPFRCYPGSTDYRCTQPTTTQPPFRCFPGSTDQRCAPRCYYGSPDPRCPQSQTSTNRPVCYPGSTDSRCAQPTTTQEPFRCYPGSTDYRCPQPTTTPEPFRCYPGSTDYRCPQPTTTPEPFRCYPGSNDYRCQQPTTQQPRCYPGSYDPRCPSQRTTTEQPTVPPGLYGAPSLPFGVRNNPKFGYNKK